MNMTIKRTVRFVVCLALALPVFAGAQGGEGLPPSIRTILDQRYPGWRVADISLDVRTTMKQRLGPEPNVISGDFDGNGWPDHALLIEYRNTDARESSTYFNEVVAFLNDEGRFRLTKLRDRDIQVWAEGDRLRCSAPPGTLTPELRDELQQHKDEVLKFLRSAGALARQ